MTSIVIQKDLHYGNSLERTLPAHIELRVEPSAGGKTAYRVLMSAPIPVDKTLKARDGFDAIRLGLAGLRQLLRHFQRQNPSIKYFDRIDGNLVEQSVEDIFWTHDCVPGS
jgi:hypothetical protein